MNATAILVFFLVFVIYLALIGLGIGSYVMNSLSLYTLAKRRSINYPWLAWVPVAGSWILGRLVSDYDGRNGRSRKWEKTLLTLAIISTAGFAVYLISVIAMSVAMSMASYTMMYGEPEVGAMVGFFVVVYLVALLWALAAGAYQIIHSICIYKVFESTLPEKAVKYILLYFLVPLAGPICLMKCRDKGYPEPIIPQEPDISDFPESTPEESPEESPVEPVFSPALEETPEEPELQE